MMWSRIKLWLGVGRRQVNPITSRHFDVVTHEQADEQARYLIAKGTGGELWSRDSGDDAVTDAIINGARPLGKPYLFPAMVTGQQIIQDAMKMDLLRAKWRMTGLRPETFEEIAEQTIKDSRHRDWDWETVLGKINAACSDRMWGPVLPDPETVPYGTMINEYRATGHPVRWVLDGD